MPRPPCSTLRTHCGSNRCRMRTRNDLVSVRDSYNGLGATVSGPEVGAYASAPSLAELAAYHYGAVVTAGNEPSRLVAYGVTPNLFDLLGVAPALGRGLRREDASRRGGRTVVISDPLVAAPLWGRCADHWSFARAARGTGHHCGRDATRIRVPVVFAKRSLGRVRREPVGRRPQCAADDDRRPSRGLGRALRKRGLS